MKAYIGSSNEAFGLTKGIEVDILKEFWYNGEVWVKFQWPSGKIDEAPECFFIYSKMENYPDKEPITNPE